MTREEREKGGVELGGRSSPLACFQRNLLNDFTDRQDLSPSSTCICTSFFASGGAPLFTSSFTTDIWQWEAATWSAVSPFWVHNNNYIMNLINQIVSWCDSVGIFIHCLFCQPLPHSQWGAELLLCYQFWQQQWEGCFWSVIWHGFITWLYCVLLSRSLSTIPPCQEGLG